jgi:hypothetical protein
MSNTTLQTIYLYHYYDADIGPFLNLSDLSVDEAKAVLNRIKTNKPHSLPAQRHDKYVEYRRNCERIIRNEFEKKGGIIRRDFPHYMVFGYSLWLSTWHENSRSIKISIEEFDINTISFTYGDSMPTFSYKVNDGKEYRKKFYTYEEIIEIIKKYGFPQEWNNDGKFGPERYTEAHIWSDDVPMKYRKMWESENLSLMNCNE